MPNDIQTYLIRAGKAYQKRSFDEAIAHLEKALDKGITNATDDCALALGVETSVKVVEGSRSNMKITNQIDLKRAERMAENQKS